MNIYAIRRRSIWANSEELEAAGNNAMRIGDEMSDRLRWIRSYIVNEPDGRLGSVCVYQARDEEVMRDHGRRVGAPSEDIRKVSKTVIVSDDPQA